jgi:hypothetical protein
MGVEVDIRKVAKYPPECFVSAMPVNLTAGDNKVAEYFTPDKYVLSLYGVSFDNTLGTDVSFYADVDGVTNTVQIPSASFSVRGLDYEEELKVPVTKTAKLRIYSPVNITGYRFRHRIAVLPKTTALKILLGLPLSERDKQLDQKFGISDMIASYPAEPIDLLKGVEQIKSVAVTLPPDGGTVFRQVVPRGWKLILLDMSMVPSDVGSLYIDVKRDNIDTLHIDSSCMPEIPYKCPVRIVATEKMEITASSPCFVRLTYGLGRITLSEKIRWGLELTQDERDLAAKMDLFDKVEAGVL